jgi:hypothetical protein
MNMEYTMCKIRESVSALLFKKISTKKYQKEKYEQSDG